MRPSRKRLIAFSITQNDQIQKEADEKAISFTEMLKRIVDHYYETTHPFPASDSTAL